jgi:hypothetical protein
MALKGKVVFSSGRAVDFDIWSLDLETWWESKWMFSSSG